MKTCTISGDSVNKVLQFPKEKSKKVRQKQKNEVQQAILTLSLFSFILVAVLSSEFVLKKERPQYLLSDNSRSFPGNELEAMNRSIANANPELVMNNLKWEKSVADKLSKDSGFREPASTNKNLSSLDQLRFETLAGKYRLISSEHPVDGQNAKVQEVIYVDSLDVSDHPVQILDFKDFLMQYQSVWFVPFASLQLESGKRMPGENIKIDEWKLLSENQKIVGWIQVQSDEKGRLLGLKVRPMGLGRVSEEK